MALQTMFPAKPNSPQTTLAAQISADATTMTVVDGSVLASAPNLLTIGTDENAEVVYYTTLSGNTVSGLVRGYSGTTASVWSEGTQVAREYTSYDHDTFINNINALQNDIDALDTELDGKQDTLTFDSTPTAGSINPVTSGGVKTALDAKTNLNQVASEFSISTAYAIDDLVIYQGSLYRFKATHAAGAWNAAHVTACTISEVMSHFAKFRVSGTVSSGSMTLTDARIDSDHWRVPNGGIYFENSSNVVSEVNWSTNIAQHTITLSATYSAATNVIVELEWMQN